MNNGLLALMITLVACGADEHALSGFGWGGKGEDTNGSQLSHVGESISFTKTLSIVKWDDGFLSLMENGATPLNDDGTSKFRFNVAELRCSSGSSCTGTATVHLETVAGVHIDWGMDDRYKAPGRLDGFAEITVAGKGPFMLNINPQQSSIGQHQEIQLTFTGAWRENVSQTPQTPQTPAQPQPSQAKNAPQAENAILPKVVGDTCDPSASWDCGSEDMYCYSTGPEGICYACDVGWKNKGREPGCETRLCSVLGCEGDDCCAEPFEECVSHGAYAPMGRCSYGTWIDE